MSKQRPSICWPRRVFRNSFTRGGRLKRVKGWSVKIQHQGLRRTISLRSHTRAAAALEARAAHDLLLNKGWDALPVGVHASACPAPKTDARYWRPRLVHRKHSAAPWSARIEHEGTSFYFPIDATDEKSAAARAAQIFQTIASTNWEAACQRFSRELTIGFHWAANPVAWTYTTVHTEVSDRKGWCSRFSVSGKNMLKHEHQPVRIALVEGDRGLQRTLARHLSRHASVHLYDCAQNALREIPRQRFDLVLVNQDLQFAHTLDRPVVIFSTYEDSNELFECTPGGALAYLLKRTAPEHLLAPIEGLLSSGTLTPEKIAEQVRQYFYGASLALQSGEALPRMSLLTPRERQILDCLSKGYVDKEIADALGISAWTVHGHVKNIFEKLEVHSRTAAVVKYLHK